jgi:hypothetical protein
MECHENTSRKKNNALKSVVVVLVVVEKSLARLSSAPTHYPHA